MGNDDQAHITHYRGLTSKNQGSMNHSGCSIIGTLAEDNGLPNGTSTQHPAPSTDPAERTAVRFLLRTLSLSYVRRHMAKTLLTLLGVVVGVATYSSIKAAQKTLVGGLRATVDRMAGKAQLQIGGSSGVPEELQEQIRAVSGVKAVAPVIEQVISPERAELGSLLVLGVDLLGDREMREYGFEGDDADLDDPLLFLAQPDSIALCRAFADRAGIRKNDTLEVRIGESRKRVVVRGLLEAKGFAEAFGGNIAITDVYAAQELFGRGRHFDRIEVRLDEGLSLEQGERALRSALGPGYEIQTPSRRGAQLERVITNFVVGFDITSFLALGIGVFLIFNAFTVSVNRRRRDIGVLRSVGATPRQIQILFLSEAAVLGVAGGAIGLIAGTTVTQGFLRFMAQTVQTLYGVTDVSTARVTLPLALQSVGLGMLASLAGAWGPARAAARVQPTEALASGRFTSSTPRHVRLRLGAGAMALTLAALISVAQPDVNPGTLVWTAMVLGLVGMTLIVSPAARQLVVWLAPLISRISPVTGRLAADSLLSHSRRTAGTVSAITLSLAFVIGTAGYIGSTRTTLLRWMDDIVTSDLFVRGSNTLYRPDYRFSPELKSDLLAVPGVRAVECYRSQRLPFRGEDILLMTIEIEGLLHRVHPTFVEGDPESMRRGLVELGQCVVSENFANRFGLGVGDTVELPAPGDTVSLRISGVIKDYTSDRGSVIIDRSVFVSRWKDDRVDIFDVNLLPGVDAHTARNEIRKKLAGKTPALVSTRKEFSEEIGRAVDAFYGLVRMSVMMALVVAFMGIVTSLIVSVVERTREIGILKALGALGPQIRRSVAYEGLVAAHAGLILALPFGALIAHFLGSTVARAYAGWTMPTHFPLDILLELAIALPVVSWLAAWLPARQAAATKVTEAIGYE